MIKTSVQVRFGAGTNDPNISVEVDDRVDGLNSGKTSFEPGDTAYMLIFKPSNVTVASIVLSAGTVISVTPGVVEKEEEVFFDDNNTATLPVPATGLVGSPFWFGRSLGTLTLQGDSVTLKAETKGVAVARVRYRTAPAAFGILSPVAIGGEVDFPINCLITVDVV